MFSRRPVARRIAALPMYDFPPLHAATDEFWSAIAARLRTAGIADVPSALTRDMGHVETWRDPRLLFGQACQYPLAKSWHEAVRLVALPAYAAPGCEGSRYRSAIIVRAADPARRLADLRGRRCAVNERDSNSGSNLLRAAIAPLADGGRFFSSVELTGGHLISASSVASDTADVAAIDCVTYAHLERLHPELAARLRILDWTPSSPGLPYVTARATDPITFSALRSALAEVQSDPALAAVRAALLQSGIDFAVDESYLEVLRLEADALARGYPELA
jgi:ABC-type phosphate/phosphonate transport system substrate-binding protein